MSRHPASLGMSISYGLEEHLRAEQEAKRGRVPIVIADPIHCDMSVVPFVGHFCVQRELFGEHVVSAPAEPPGEVVAG